MGGGPAPPHGDGDDQPGRGRHLGFAEGGGLQLHLDGGHHHDHHPEMLRAAAAAAAAETGRSSLLPPRREPHMTSTTAWLVGRRLRQPTKGRFTKGGESKEGSKGLGWESHKDIQSESYAVMWSLRPHL